MTRAMVRVNVRPAAAWRWGFRLTSFTPAERGNLTLVVNVLQSYSEEARGIYSSLLTFVRRKAEY